MIVVCRNTKISSHINSHTQKLILLCLITLIIYLSSVQIHSSLEDTAEIAPNNIRSVSVLPHPSVPWA
jgi:hypothetical protein